MLRTRTVIVTTQRPNGDVMAYKGWARRWAKAKRLAFEIFRQSQVEGEIVTNVETR